MENSPEIQKRINRFYLIEKIYYRILLALFIFGAICILLSPALYYNFGNTLFFKYYIKLTVGIIITTITLGIIHGNRPRRCPVCKTWMTRLAPINNKIIYKCERHKIEINTHLQNTTS